MGPDRESEADVATDGHDKDPLVALSRSLLNRPAIPPALPPFLETTYADLHGPGLKNRIRAVIWRVITPLLGLQRPFNSIVVDQLNRLLIAHREAQTHLAQFQTNLVQHLQGTNALAEDWLKRWDSLAALEARIRESAAAVDDLRATSALAQQTALSLKREVERLTANPRASGQAAPAATPDFDAGRYLGFEDAFRGSREDIRARMA